MSQISFDFTGFNFIITGASSGMGRQVTIELASAGAKVLAIARGKVALESLKALYPTTCFNSLSSILSPPNKKIIKIYPNFFYLSKSFT